MTPAAECNTITRGQYEIIDGFEVGFKPVKLDPCGQPLGTYYALVITVGGPHNTITNNLLTQATAGIHISKTTGDYNTITHNILAGNNVMQEPFDGSGDLGAWGKLVRGGHNDISHNSAIDDHSRLAYSEILPDERGPTCAAFLARAAEYFAAHGINRIERVMTDNAWNYTHSGDMAAVLTELDAKHKLIQPHCPWQTAKSSDTTERLPANRRTGRSSPTTTSAQQPCQTSSTPTTTGDATPPSTVNHRSADCHQPDGRVHLAAPRTLRS